jgi:hypothetical protein
VTRASLFVVVMASLLLSTQEAQCDRARLGEKFTADTAIANSKREFDLKKSNFQQEVNQKV